MSRTLTLVASGAVIGALALLLAANGNPPNMGVCVACFLRDTAGALKLHNAAPVQYLRPEILGFVLGAFGAALASREFRPTAGSSPVLRFALGFFMMIGCLVFLGCPLRMVQRIAGGDLNAVVGLFGFAAGVAVGALFLRGDFALPPHQPQPDIEGAWFPLLAAGLLALFVFKGDLFAASAQGPGSQRAPVWMALAGGLVIGAIVQRTRFCFIGMISHAILFRRFSMLLGVAALTFVVFLGDSAQGIVKVGFEGQPIAHNDALWNFLGMALAGLCGAFLGGCPLRQVVGAGQGSSDSAMTVIGMLAGGAAAHNFALASSAAGPTPGGKIVTAAGIAFALAVGWLYSRAGRPVAASPGVEGKGVS
ncbi:MAG: YedE-related selenium metabolism membrane protein [Candidatus Accumulibacter sp.]|jgi:YedE family putative selenium metabolism protein|nr:YedE-related selenium metabolism membrane protein [Accumulibacter sp.]